MWELSQKILGLGEGPVNEVFPAGKLSAQQALGVYANGYQVRLIDSLLETYGCVFTCLGAESFTKIAKEYIQIHPSRSYSLSHYGEHFPIFLKNHPSLQDFPFLPDLAQFEWEFCELFHAKLDTADALDLAKTDQRDFNLKYVSHLRLFQFSYAVLDLWNAVQKEAAEMPKWDHPQCLILYRAGTDLRLRELSLTEYYFLHFLKSKSLTESVSEVEALGLCIKAETVSSLFTFLAAEGLIKCIAE